VAIIFQSLSNSQSRLAPYQEGIKELRSMADTDTDHDLSDDVLQPLRKYAAASAKARAGRSYNKTSTPETISMRLSNTAKYPSELEAPEFHCHEEQLFINAQSQSR